MDVEYKIYAEILRRRLVKELEEREYLGDMQMEYRPGRETMNAVYVQTGLENEIRKSKGRANIMFADVKGAFDEVQREDM